MAQTRNPEAIEDLRAFFCKLLIRAINRQLSLSVRRCLAEDIGAIADRFQDASPSGTSSPTSVASEAQLRILADAALTRLERDRAELMATIPARSGDPGRYRCTIVAAAGTILRLLLRGPVAMADWNAVLRSGYPQWCDEPGFPHDALYQRLSLGTRRRAVAAPGDPAQGRVRLLRPESPRMSDGRQILLWQASITQETGRRRQR